MTDKFTLRKPNAEDGSAIHDLASRCPPLDCNSLYCNLLQASHFRDTAILAENRGEIQGYVTGYLLPTNPNCLFVWQVAVSPEARGRGLALTMLEALLLRLPEVDYLETTVTPSNESSMKLFHRLAKRAETTVHERVLFETGRHFQGSHEDEILLRIGPFHAASTNMALADEPDIFNSLETSQSQFSRMKTRIA